MIAAHATRHDGWVRHRLRGARVQPDADDARRDLEALTRALQRKHPGAAASLREGLEQALPVARLKIDGSLLRTVFSTSQVESMIEIICDHTAHVQRWRDGEVGKFSEQVWGVSGSAVRPALGRRRDGLCPGPVLAGQGLPAAARVRPPARARHHRRG